MIPALILTLMMSCRESLIAPDPYQYRNLTVDRIVELYHEHEREKFTNDGLDDEIRHRLRDPHLNDDDREILTKLLGDYDD